MTIISRHSTSVQATYTLPNDENVPSVGKADETHEIPVSIVVYWCEPEDLLYISTHVLSIYNNNNNVNPLARQKKPSPSGWSLSNGELSRCARFLAKLLKSFMIFGFM